MASSNILDVIHPQTPHDITGEEAKDCIPCQVMGSITALLAGGYFSSGYLFKNDTDYKKIPNGGVMVSGIWDLD